MKPLPCRTALLFSAVALAAPLASFHQAKQRVLFQDDLLSNVHYKSSPEMAIMVFTGTL